MFDISILWSLFGLLFLFALEYFLTSGGASLLGKVEAGDFLSYGVAKGDYELIATECLGDSFAFQIQDREGVDPRVTITHAKLAIRVRAPAPRDAFVVDGNSDRVSKTHIAHSIRDGQYLLRIRILAKNPSAPEEKFAFRVDAS